MADTRSADAQENLEAVRRFCGIAAIYVGESIDLKAAYDTIAACLRDLRYGDQRFITHTRLDISGILRGSYQWTDPSLSSVSRRSTCFHSPNIERGQCDTMCIAQLVLKVVHRLHP